MNKHIANITDKELRESFLAVNKQIDENSKQIAETRALIAENSKQMAESDARLEKQMAETRVLIAENSKQIDDLRTFINNDIGTTAQANEEFFFRSLERSLRLGNVQYDSIGRNLRLNNHSPEFDIVLFNHNAIAIAEVKKKAERRKLASMAAKKVARFKEMLPNYANYTFYFAIASMITHDDLVKEAKKAGIYLLAQGGDDKLTYLNDNVRPL